MSESSVIPWMVAFQAPLSMGFPRQEYWSGLPFPSQGDLPDPEIELEFPALAGGFFTVDHQGSLNFRSCYSVSKSCPTLCTFIDSNTPGFSVLHYLPEFAQTHVH